MIATIADPGLARAINEALGRLGTTDGLLSVRTLIANGKGIRTLAGIGALSRLHELELNASADERSSVGLVRNAISDLRPLAGLADLRLLSLAGNPMTTLDGVAELGSLEVLNLARCSLASVSEVARLSSLRKLCLAECSKRLDFSELGHLSRLSLLDLKGTKLISGDFLRSLAGLERLVVGRTGITTLDPVVSSHLLMLDVSDNPLKDLGPLRGLRSLRFLSLSGCKDLVDFVPLSDSRNLEVLRIESIGLADLNWIPELRSLRKLMAAGNRLSALECLEHLQELEELDLVGNPVGEWAPLLGMRRLRTVHVSASPSNEPSVFSELRRRGINVVNHDDTVVS